MPRRHLRRSAQFVAQAQALFPPRGAAEGRPSFEAFEQGPLRAAETAFATAFERQCQHIDGMPSIRYVLVTPTAFFGPLVISAVLLRDDSVELVSVVADHDYWDLLGDDPIALSSTSPSLLTRRRKEETLATVHEPRPAPW